MILGKNGGTTTATYWLAATVGCRVEAWRQRLRERCYKARKKAGSEQGCAVVQGWWLSVEWVLALDGSVLWDGMRVVAISVLCLTKPRRWVVERLQAWLNHFRRLLVCWDKQTRCYLAFAQREQCVEEGEGERDRLGCRGGGYGQGGL